MQRFFFMGSGRSENQAILEDVTVLCAEKVDKLTFHQFGIRGAIRRTYGVENRVPAKSASGDKFSYG
jgi:hypothetical protein